MLTYKDEKRSYRDLPLRWAELGTVYRYERSRLAETRREDPGGPVCRDGRPGTVHALLRLPGASFPQPSLNASCRSGTLNGLFRVRGFTQDDAHIFCLPEQLADEIQGPARSEPSRSPRGTFSEPSRSLPAGVLDLTETILTKFGFTEYEAMLPSPPPTPPTPLSRMLFYRVRGDAPPPPLLLPSLGCSLREAAVGSDHAVTPPRRVRDR